MATSIDRFAAVSGVFPGQTDLTSIDLTDAGVNGGNILAGDDGSEIIFNLLNHCHNVIEIQKPSNELSNLTSTSTSSVSGDNLVKTYTFNVTLGLGDAVESLNVADESGD